MVERFERFSYAIFEISRCWHKIAAEEMGQYGLRGPHAIYLIIMRRYPDGITAAQLCELCGRDKADVSRSMALMEQQGLIVREGTQYRALLKLTESGEAAAQAVCDRAAMAVELAGKGIDEADREVFYASLASITSNLQTLCKEGLPTACNCVQ